jgi:hypothetical protein
MKLFYLALLGCLPVGAFAQKVNRQPQNIVRTDVQNKTNGDLVIVEGNRTTTIHADGSRTITVDATQVSPSSYSAQSQQQNPAPSPVTMQWTKEDLELYIACLEAKKVHVSQIPEEHTKAIVSGWYDFIDEMIRQSKELLSSMY